MPVPSRNRDFAAIANALKAENIDIAGCAPYEALTLSELWNQQPPAWLLEDVIQEESCSLVFGPSGSGKTFLVLDVCRAICLGMPWNGHPTRKAPILYFAAEDANGLNERTQALANFHDFAGDVPFAVLDQRPDLVGIQREDDFRRVIATVWALSVKWRMAPGVIVIDTLNKTFGFGDENSTRDMTAFVANCETLARIFGAVVIVVHHSNKSDATNARGSSALVAGVSSVFEVQRKDDVVTVVCRKQKNAAALAKQSFQLVPVEWSDLQRGRHSSQVLFPCDGAPASDVVAILAAAGPAGMTGKEWETAAQDAGISRSGFYDKRKKAVERKIVLEMGGRYVLFAE